MSKKFSFSPKDGFQELPYLLSSPQEMIENYKRMPFIKYNAAKQYISTKMPFLDIIVRYREAEEGLFLIYSEAKFKANICFHHVQDKSATTQHYCLSLRIDHYAKAHNSMAGGISYTDNSWLIFKPDAKVDHYHFKGTRGKYFSVFFTADWLKEYMKQLSESEKALLSLFLESGSDHLICPNLPGNKVYNTDNLCELLINGKPADSMHIVRLREEIQGFLSFFISKMQFESIDEMHFKVSNQERIKTLKAERFLREHAGTKFPGIAAIAQHAGFSETKLKECFKTVYNKTVFQYFQGLQMDRAREMILQTDMPIFQIALNFCYEHPGKFAAAFKACHGVLPSDIKELSTTAMQ